jgi:ADP-ribose pyrophosphatase YjhB (NUDIX family)
MTTAFGEHVELSDESIRSAAVRELREETNLAFAPNQLRYFKTYRKLSAMVLGNPTLKVAYVVITKNLFSFFCNLPSFTTEAKQKME